MNVPVVGRLDTKSVVVGVLLVVVLVKFGNKIPVVGPAAKRVLS